MTLENTRPELSTSDGDCFSTSPQDWSRVGASWELLQGLPFLGSSESSQNRRFFQASDLLFYVYIYMYVYIYIHICISYSSAKYTWLSISAAIIAVILTIVRYDHWSRVSIGMDYVLDLFILDVLSQVVDDVG